YHHLYFLLPHSPRRQTRCPHCQSTTFTKDIQILLLFFDFQYQNSSRPYKVNPIRLLAPASSVIPDTSVGSTDSDLLLGLPALPLRPLEVLYRLQHPTGLSIVIATSLLYFMNR